MDTGNDAFNSENLKMPCLHALHLATVHLLCSRGGLLTPSLTCTFANSFRVTIIQSSCSTSTQIKFCKQQRRRKMVPQEHFAGGLITPLLTLQMLLLTSCDCNRKGDVGRAIDGKTNTVELYNHVQSKFKLLSHTSFSPYTKWMRRHTLSLKHLKYM